MAENYLIPPGLYLMDCMDGMKRFPDKFFDLAIVDPPYGISIGHKVKNHCTIVGGVDAHSEVTVYVTNPARSNCARPTFYHPFDDSRPPDEGYFTELRRVARHVIIWGGNYFLDHLGSCSCMIVWDKGKRGMDQADCELAWTNLPGQSRVYNFKWNGMLQEDMKNKEERIHPTQKPVALYQWLLARFARTGDKILDTHVGSASSLVACHRAGFDQAWGFEIDPTYFKKAKDRLDKEKAQITIFDIIKEEEQCKMD